MPSGTQSIEAHKKSQTNTISPHNPGNLMEAMIGACAYVAHADGELHHKERQRVLRLMRTLPALNGTPEETFAAALARQERAFAVEPRLARKRALDAIEALKLQEPEAQIFISTCRHVLEADGTHHLSEYQALHDICRALDGQAASAVSHAKS